MPSKRSLDAMVSIVGDGGGYHLSWDQAKSAALVTDRLVAEAVQAERQRILDALANEEWPDPETGHQALLASVVRLAVEDTP